MIKQASRQSFFKDPRLDVHLAWTYTWTEAIQGPNPKAVRNLPTGINLLFTIRCGPCQIPFLYRIEQANFPWALSLPLNGKSLQKFNLAPAGCPRK